MRRQAARGRKRCGEPPFQVTDLVVLLQKSHPLLGQSILGLDEALLRERVLPLFPHDLLYALPLDSDRCLHAEEGHRGVGNLLLGCSGQREALPLGRVPGVRADGIHDALQFVGQAIPFVTPANFFALVHVLDERLEVGLEARQRIRRA